MEIKPRLSDKIKRLNPLTYFLLKDAVPVIIDPEDFKFIKEYCWHLSVRSNGILDVCSTCEALRKKFNKSSVYLREFVYSCNGIPVDEEKVIDHINRNPLDNRKGNLRLVLKWCDSVNRAKTVNKSSQYKGVTLLTEPGRNKKWRAEIKVRGESIHLGHYLTETEAALAFNVATKAYNLEFGDYNIVDQNVCWDIIYSRNQTISALKNKLTRIRELIDLEKELSYEG